jgi:hypothetical protein
MNAGVMVIMRRFGIAEHLTAWWDLWWDAKTSPLNIHIKQ